MSLDWPAGFDRTDPGDREPYPHYRVTLARALDELEEQLDLLDAEEYRLSTAAPQRQGDGRPYANANPDDPSAVIYWTADGEQYAVACDAYDNLRDNVRTIGLYVEEKRKMSTREVRTGEAEFANARLPPADESAVVPAEPPHEVLGVASDADPTVVEAAARSLKAKHHPDAGGDVEQFKRVVRAEEAMLDD